MSDNSYRRNHYVPQWYQERFLPPNRERKFFYLDLRPDVILAENGKKYPRKNIRRLGAASCFYQEDLYTTKFNDWSSTEIEQKFFGNVDFKGLEAVSYLSEFTYPNWRPSKHLDFLRYLSIQKLRTPKGLRDFQRLINTTDHNTILFRLQQLQAMFCATWSECVRQIGNANSSETKFIISDHPVTVYNRKCLPGSKECNGMLDPDVRMNGTHTIFPLSPEKILILTNLSWARNPSANPLKLRPNPSLFRESVIDVRTIQVDRDLDETEVREMNFIIKKGASRFIAAAEKDWLYPEKYLKQTGWFMLGQGDLLMPDPRSMVFGGNVFIGYKGGQSQAFDEYGRKPGQIGYSHERHQDEEMEKFLINQAQFARKHGPKRRGRSYQFDRLDSEEDSFEMHKAFLDQIKGNVDRKRK